MIKRLVQYHISSCAWFVVLLSYLVYFPVQQAGIFHLASLSEMLVPIMLLIGLVSFFPTYKNIKADPFLVLILCYFIYLLINAAFAISPLHALKWDLKFIMIALFVLLFTRKKEAFYVLVQGLVVLGFISTMLIFVYTAFDMLRAFYDNNVSHVTIGPYVHFVSFAFIILLTRFFSRLSWVQFALLCFLFAAIVLWGSRAELLAITVATVLGFFISKIRYKWRFALAALCIFIAGILFLAYAGKHFDNPLWWKFSAAPLSEAFWHTVGVQSRTLLWQMAYHTWQLYPWLGVGADNFSVVHIPLPAGAVGLAPYYIQFLSAHHDPHNIILSLLVQQGVIGLILFMGIVVFSIVKQCQCFVRGEPFAKVLLLWSAYMLCFSMFGVVFDFKTLVLFLLPVLAVYHYQR